jgi:hypothetical protein
MSSSALLLLVPVGLLLFLLGSAYLGMRHVRIFAAAPVVAAYIVAGLMIVGGVTSRPLTYVRLHGVELDLVDGRGEARWVPVGGRAFGMEGGRPDAVIVPGYPAEAFLLGMEDGQLVLRPGAGFRPGLMARLEGEILATEGGLPRLLRLVPGDMIVVDGGAVAGGEGGPDLLGGRLGWGGEGRLGRRASLSWEADESVAGRVQEVWVRRYGEGGGGSIMLGGGVEDAIYIGGLASGAARVRWDGGGEIIVEDVGEGAGDRGLPRWLDVSEGASIELGGGQRPGSGILEVAEVRESEVLLRWEAVGRTEWILPNRETTVPFVSWRLALFERQPWSRRVYPLSEAAGVPSRVSSSVVYGASGRGDGASLLLLDRGVSVRREGAFLAGPAGRSAITGGGSLDFLELSIDGGLLPELADGGKAVVPRDVRRRASFAEVSVVELGGELGVKIRYHEPKIVALDGRLLRGGRMDYGRLSVNDPMNFSSERHKIQFPELGAWFAEASVAMDLGEREVHVEDDLGYGVVPYGERFIVGRDARLEIDVARSGFPLKEVVALAVGALLFLLLGQFFFCDIAGSIVAFAAAYLASFRLVLGVGLERSYPFVEAPLQTGIVLAMSAPLVLAALFGIARTLLRAGDRSQVLRLARGVSYGWLIALVVAMVLLRLGFVFTGAKESVQLMGHRLALSLISVPGFLVIFALAWCRLECGRKSDGELPSKEIVLFCAFLMGVYFPAQGIIAALVSDLGLVLFAVPVALVMVALALEVGLGALRLAGRSRWWRIVVALPLALPLVGMVLLFARPTAVVAMVPGVGERLEMEENIVTDSTLLRLLQFVDTNALVNMGTDLTERIAQDHAFTSNYAQRGLFGQGYLGVEIVPAKRETGLNDNVFSVLVLAQFGGIGGAALVLVYLGVAGAGALVGAAASRRAELGFAGRLAVVAALSIAGVSLYMMAANFGLLPFTGRNMYWLGLNSIGDILEGGLLMGMIVLGIEGVRGGDDVGMTGEVLVATDRK